MALTLDAIRALPAMHDSRVLACISNPAGGALVGNVKVSGADAAYLWPRLDIQPNATHARLEAADGYSTGVTLETLTQPGVMLAYAMNDAPLTIEHGYPLRVLIPGLYGQKMPRWITRLTFLDEPYLGFWERRGYSDAAAMLTTSMIHSPHDGSELPANTPIHLQGVAYGGKRSITHVEVQIDDGGWLEAQIITPSSPLAWTTWHLDWRTPARGQVRIGVRATDAAGFTQTEDADHRLSAGPHGTNAIHRITVYVS
jgi:DMSO/TMAO reductase YedYZ molybdopterin-dependent catalytic subunit